VPEYSKGLPKQSLSSGRIDRARAIADLRGFASVLAEAVSADVQPGDFDWPPLSGPIGMLV
jgi:hypothetical protein